LVRQCRIVATGSYHGAVFALAQGIPAVCLTNSDYYDQKFRGLRALFGEGCHVVSLRDPGFTNRFSKSLDLAWLGADEDRAQLCAAAAQQVEDGKSAYARLLAVVG
jgi:colanic acid/amylovoran biosynthesis protein